MKTKLLKKLRKKARKYVRFKLDSINYIRDSYNIKSYIGKFYYIYYDECNHRSDPPYLTDTYYNVYSENDLKKSKQKLIEKSVYYMMRWLKFKKRKNLVTLIQKKINTL